MRANASFNVEIGGLVGVNGYGCDVSDSYASGAPSAPAGSYVGGLLGEDGGGTFTDTYWDTTTSGIANPSQGAGDPPNDPGITGETTSQLQSGLPLGFGADVWAESPSINGGLPYLLANPPQ